MSGGRRDHAFKVGEATHDLFSQIISANHIRTSRQSRIGLVALREHATRTLLPVRGKL